MHVSDGRVTAVVHGLIHCRERAVNGPCTRPHTRTVCRNGPHTAVACRLGTCTRPGRPTCRIHGPDGPCTRPCNGRVHGPLHGRVRAMWTAENGSVHRQGTRPKTAVHTARTLPCTRADTARTRPYTRHGRVLRVDGRFRRCRWPVHG